MILSIDSIYFSDPDIVIPAWKALLKPIGKIAVLFLSLDGSDMSATLKKHGLSFVSYDLSKENWEHQQLKYHIAGEMRGRFESEGNLFIWENLMAESVSDLSAYDPDKTPMRRYLYITHI